MKNNKDKIEKISEERKNYLSKVKNRKLTIILTQIGIIIAFIALWEILARLGKIDRFTKTCCYNGFRNHCTDLL